MTAQITATAVHFARKRPVKCRADRLEDDFFRPFLAVGIFRRGAILNHSFLNGHALTDHSWPIAHGQPFVANRSWLVISQSRGKIARIRSPSEKSMGEYLGYQDQGQKPLPAQILRLEGKLLFYNDLLPLAILLFGRLKRRFLSSLPEKGSC